MSVMADTLQAARLDLRVFKDSDAKELHEIFSDPATHTIGDGAIADMDFTRDWIRHRHQRHHEYGVAWYSVRLVGAGTMVGNAGLFMGRTEPHPELGFEIRRDYQRLGFGREAASTVLAEAFRAGFEEVWATVRDWNEPSLHALHSLGFERERVEADERGRLVYLSRSVP
jgi:RimJ/RimL family protein N-acetyltransferase